MSTNPKLGVLFIHGIGSQDVDFADGMIAKLRKELKDPDAVEFETVHWAPLIEEKSQSMWKRLTTRKLGWKFLRKYFINALGDATAYNNEMYDDVHTCIEDAMMALRHKLHYHPFTPVIVVAHSLGCAMITDYIWDRQHSENMVTDRFMLPIKGIFTMGCNIPVFALSHEPIHAIDASEIKWVNIYDKDDIMGYPLQPVSESYAEAVDADMQVNTGRWWSSWNPLSHNDYWTDNDVIDIMSEVMNIYLLD